MYISEILKPGHNKKAFSCGIGMLDNYLQKQAKQDISKKLSACFVIVDTESNLIKGYYTLSNSSILQKLIPDAFKKKLPKSYSSIPTTLLGRLAIDNRFQGKGFGKALLLDALKRSYDISKNMGSYAVVVDPFDLSAEGFYSNYGFIKLPDSAKMFLPMGTINQLFP
jgi:predicted GNAT family N-acyltransferase